MSVFPSEMKKISIMALLLTAVSLSAAALRQYHFIDQKKNWTGAQTFCREKYTDLVTITNTEEQTEIKNIITRSEKEVWIGLKSTWVWSLSDPDINTVDQTQYQNWDTTQPEGDGDCVHIKKNKKWHDIDCSAVMDFICYNGSVGYGAVKEQKNWSDAQKHCRESHMVLAIVRNENESKQINISNEDAAWIGLRRLWVWSDNSTSTFTNWKPGKPNIRNNREGICASFNHEGERWKDESCTADLPFVCYEDKLFLIRENKTWMEALRHCRGLDMDLVSVQSEEIQQWVKLKASAASSAHVWLGLRHSCTLDLWFWVSGETLCYSQWAQGYDADLDECLTTMRSGAVQRNEQRWTSRPETERNNFICAKQ